VIYVVLILWAAGMIYQFLALVCLWRFFHRPMPNSPTLGARQGISVLKPLRGLESCSREALASFLTQDYHPYQVLFGVAEAEDTALPLLKELKETFPQTEVDIVVCGEKLGLNPKVSILRQLEPLARYELMVISDGDVKVGRDFLSQVNGAWEAHKTGLICCPYRAGEARTLGAQLEALSISADFIPSVTVAAWLEGIRFALGAVMVTSRQVLAQTGGLAAIADFLADDYQLGWRIHQAGLDVKLLPYVVETTLSAMSFADYFLHQLRWSRTYRVCRPKGYLAFGITQVLVLSLMVWALSGFAVFGLGVVAATLSVRLALAYFSERLCLKGALPAHAFMWLPLKDLSAFVLWLLSFLGHKVVWGGLKFRLQRDGKLVPE